MGLFGSGGVISGGVEGLWDVGGGLINSVGSFFMGNKIKPNYAAVPTIDKTPFMRPDKSLADAQSKLSFEQAQKSALGNIMAARGVNPALMQRMGQTASEDLFNKSMQQSMIGKLAEDQAARERLIQYEQMNQNQGIAKMNASIGAGTANAGIQGAALGGLGTAIGGMAQSGMFSSDKRVKKNFKDGGEDLNKLLDAFSKSKEFEYKDKSMGKGKHVGPMAQDIEKAMPDMVSEDENGVKKVDMTKAIMAMMAAQGKINKELKKLKKKVA